MKKFFSALFTLLILAGIGFLIYTHPEFVRKQLDKVQGVYYVYKGDKELRKLKLQKAIFSVRSHFLKKTGTLSKTGWLISLRESYLDHVNTFLETYHHFLRRRLR